MRLILFIGLVYHVVYGEDLYCGESSCYSVLGLLRYEATQQSIRKSYRKLDPYSRCIVEICDISAEKAWLLFEKAV